MERREEKGRKGKRKYKGKKKKRREKNGENIVTNMESKAYH